MQERMKYFSNRAVLTAVLATGMLTASAQKIEEQELKVEVNKISNSTALLEKLHPVTYKYDHDKFKHLNLPAGTRYGLLTGSLKQEFPELVAEKAKFYSQGKNTAKVAKYDDVNTEHLIPVLVAAMKEQQEQIELLKKQVESLKSR